MSIVISALAAKLTSLMTGSVPPTLVVDPIAIVNLVDSIVDPASFTSIVSIAPVGA